MQPKAVRVGVLRLEVLATTDEPGVACLRIWHRGNMHAIGYCAPDDPAADVDGYVVLTNCTRVELENLAEAINMYLEAFNAR